MSWLIAIGSMKEINAERNSDEADVFLESRGKGPGSNTERNALVSGKQAQNLLNHKRTADPVKSFSGY